MLTVYPSFPVEGDPSGHTHAEALGIRSPYQKPTVVSDFKKNEKDKVNLNAWCILFSPMGLITSWKAYMLGPCSLFNSAGVCRLCLPWTYFTDYKEK